MCIKSPKVLQIKSEFHHPTASFLDISYYPDLYISATSLNLVSAENCFPIFLHGQLTFSTDISILRNVYCAGP